MRSLSAFFVIAFVLLNILAQPFQTRAQADKFSRVYEISQIAFEADIDGDRDIYLIGEDGTNLRPITDNTADDRNVSWSPDGRQLVFQSNMNGNWDVYLMNPDGTELRNLTDHLASDFDPAWSPNGSELAFVSDRDGDWEIYILEIETNEIRQITNNEIFDRQPAWSPDGQKLAYASDVGGDWEIFVISLVDKQISLGEQDGSNTQPAWSPDGQKIAFVSSRNDEQNIYVMNADGRSVKRLTNDGHSTHPAWSPDGEKIVYVSNTDGQTHIYTMKNDGKERTQLTEENAFYASPSWYKQLVTLEFSDARVVTIVEDVLGYETVPLLNCGGTAEISQTAFYSNTVTREVSFIYGEEKQACTGTTSGVQLQATLPPISGVVLTPEIYYEIQQISCTAVSEGFKVSEGEIITEGRSITLRAAPGTSVTYVVQWALVRQHGVIEITANESLVIPLSWNLDDKIRPVIIESENVGCP
jgi:Tol biopolymer transport system component